jgi:hypothetical protein
VNERGKSMDLLDLLDATQPNAGHVRTFPSTIANKTHSSQDWVIASRGTIALAVLKDGIVCLRAAAWSWTLGSTAMCGRPYLSMAVYRRVQAWIPLFRDHRSMLS